MLVSTFLGNGLESHTGSGERGSGPRIVTLCNQELKGNIFCAFVVRVESI